MKSSIRPTPRQKLRQIIVMGGGGFSMEPRNPRLDRYVLAASKQTNPRICFVPTASGDSDDYIRRFHRAMKKHTVHASALTLFRLDGTDPAKMLLDQDIIYVGGGSTANLLAIWRLHGVDRIMRQAWQRGIVLCGLSTGMICWFQSSVTDSFGPVGGVVWVARSGSDPKSLRNKFETPQAACRARSSVRASCVIH